MTRDQIKSLINRKIFGQGNQVDLGTALPNILNAIMDLGASTEEVDDFENFDPETSYAEGDIVRKDGKLYKFTTNHDGEWEFADVEQTNVMEIIGVPIKPFTLLAEPTEDMTTPEQLATTGLTKEIIIDMSRGWYSCILLPIGDDKFERMPIISALENEVTFGYYIGGSFETASLYRVSFVNKNVVMVTTMQV